MPKLALTQAAVNKLPTPATTTVYWDSNLAGFGVRVSPRGRKTFFCQYRVSGGREVVETIGTTQMLPKVADARERARVSLLQAKGGINPVAQRRQRQAAEQAAAAAQALTFGKLAARYVSECVTPNCKPRSVAEVDRLLTLAARFFGDKPVQAITKADIFALISQPPRKPPSVAHTGGRVEGSNRLNVVRRTFRWAIEHDLITSDPTLGVKKPSTRKGERDRVLDDAEIVRFWEGCDAIGYPFGPLFQMLLLSGQRVREVSELPWAELDLPNRVWHLPKGRAKNSKAHEIQLSDAALAIINALPRIVSPSTGEPQYLFTVDGARPVSGFGRAKLQVVEAMGVNDWQLRDLRRTATTLMARLRVPPHVADKVLNHVKGTIGGVAGIYNRFEYREEREEALDTLGRFVMGLVHPETTQGKVVALRSA